MKINVEKFKRWLLRQGEHDSGAFYTDFFHGRIDALQDVYNAVAQGDREFMEEDE